MQQFFIFGMSQKVENWDLFIFGGMLQQILQVYFFLKYKTYKH